MTKEEVLKMLEPFGITEDKIEYDYSDFNTELLTEEPCPECGCEVNIKQDGTSNCSHCGHKNILPCSECPLRDLYLCDWNEETLCTPFKNLKK